MEVRNVMDHYEIYRDGAFVCSCDANELDEVLEEMGGIEMLAGGCRKRYN